MELKKGRLIDHIHLRVADLKASEAFYKAIAEVLGLDSFSVQDGFFTCDELFVSPSEDYRSRVHLAFQTDTRKTVDAFHKAALAAGGQDNGKPGEREYHPGYYGAYVLDPDGNNIEAVHHGPAERSTDAVTFTFAGEGDNSK